MVQPRKTSPCQTERLLMGGKESNQTNKHCLLVNTKSIFRERKTTFSEIITCDPSMFIIDYPDLTVPNFMKNSVGPERVEFIYVFSVLCSLCFCVRLFICALWSPAGKGLTSWLWFVVSNCEFVTFPLVSWVRCGT